MKDREKQIEDKFFELLEKHSIEEIDVNMICNELHIRRQSFYYHYRNVYDLVYSIYLNKEIKCEDSNNFDCIIKSLLDFLFDDEDFNREIHESNASDILSQYVFSYLVRHIGELIKKENYSLDEHKDITRFISKALAEQILFYFSNKDYTKSDINVKINSLIKIDLSHLLY